MGIISLASPYPVELEIVEGGRASGAGKTVHHPLLKRAGSTGDVSTVGRFEILQESSGLLVLVDTNVSNPATT